MQQSGLEEKWGHHMLPILFHEDQVSYLLLLPEPWTHWMSAGMNCSSSFSEIEIHRAQHLADHYFWVKDCQIVCSQLEETGLECQRTRGKAVGKKVSPNYPSEFGVKGAPASLPMWAPRRRDCHLEGHGCQEVQMWMSGGLMLDYDHMQLGTRMIEKTEQNHRFDI